MPKNIILNPTDVAAIDEQVAKIIRALGNPEPPLHLEEVRDLLRLDIGYFSSTSTDYVSEKVHQLRYAGKQIIERPTILYDVIKKMDLRALFLPDRKRILIDENLPDSKKRWSEAHEVAHSILEWHGEMMFGDCRLTLTADYHDHLEAEANYGAGRLLFLMDAFDRHAQQLQPTVKNMRKLSALFGNTLTSTMWRYVERNPGLMFHTVTDHPRYPSVAFDHANPIRQFVRSNTFSRMFGQLPEIELFGEIKKCTGHMRKGPIGQGEIIVGDGKGERHVFEVEIFHNTYDALTIGNYKKVAPILVANF